MQHDWTPDTSVSFSAGFTLSANNTLVLSAHLYGSNKEKQDNVDKSAFIQSCSQF